MRDGLEGGFADPVLDAQSAFRAIMDGMARPGTVQSVRLALVPPAPFTPVTAAVALTLCDHETPVWLDPALAASLEVARWLAFHSGAPLTQEPSEAVFAFAADPQALPPLAGFSQGSPEYPDRSTTLVLAVEEIESSSAGAAAPCWVLDGPGIEATERLLVRGLCGSFVEQWRDNRARFPRGVDVILAGRDRLACLPRTTTIKEG